MPNKIEMTEPISVPVNNKRLRSRAMRKGRLSRETLKLAEDAGWILFYSFRSMRGKVVAYKKGQLWGPIEGNDSVLELLVDEKLFGDNK